MLADDAIARLPDLCAEFAAGRRVAVLMDVRTRVVAGAAVAASLAGAGGPVAPWSVQEVIVPDGADQASPVCDVATHRVLDRQVGGVDLVVPVGSGVVCDLGKWLAFDRCVPFVPFATALSMNGYTSANVAPTIDGVKTLLRAAAPQAVVASPKVLAAAPYEMTASGLGDVLAKSVSSADWYLNHALFGDYYCQAAVDLIARIEPLYTDRPGDLLWRRGEAMEALFHALLLTGVAMTMAGSSAPASGGEHMISHSLDMLAGVDGRGHDLHGRQVGVGTVLCAELYRRVLEIESPDCLPPREAVDEGFWGPLAPAVARQYADKVPRLRQVGQQLRTGSTWDDLRRTLAAMLRSPQTVASCLTTAGAAVKAADIGCDRNRLLSVFLHAHEIRSRVTILDLAGLLGLMPASAAEIVDSWA
ncbi:MAG: iron-containing alcohol dehydrogenase [Phycisphaerae bacterium]|jgi:glycerol-1-phosphate dehydrogenase [NAD(P)+]